MCFVALTEIKELHLKFDLMEVFTEKPHTLAIYQDSIVYLCNLLFLVILLKDYKVLLMVSFLPEATYTDPFPRLNCLSL